MRNNKVPPIPAVAVVVASGVQDPDGKKLSAYEFCHYCGKIPEVSRYGSYGNGLTYVDPDVYWDGCDEGRRRGALEIIRQRNILTAKVFQKQNLPYEEHRPCPKCGNEHRSTEFKTGGQGHSMYGSGFPFIHPYIERLCGRCTFHSYEVPLDFDPVAAFPPEPKVNDDE